MSCKQKKIKEFMVNHLNYICQAIDDVIDLLFQAIDDVIDLIHQAIDDVIDLLF